jgi:ABC-type uncharacterized transport system permease subunit
MFSNIETGGKILSLNGAENSDKFEKIINAAILFFIEIKFFIYSSRLRVT